MSSTGGYREPIAEERKVEFLGLYFDEGLSAKAAAAKCGFSEDMGYKVLNDPSVLAKYAKKAGVRKIRADIKIALNSEAAVDKQVELMNKDVADNMLYIQQNAARDILDRAGVRAATEEKQDVRISFVDGLPEVNMPIGDTGDEEAEDGESLGE